MEESSQKKDYTLPVSIVIAALLISVSLVYNAGKRGNVDLSAELKRNVNGVSSKVSVRPVSTTDHIFGNPGAPIKVIEFSDFECPFCKRFHPTMKKIVEVYAGKVAWVYRHYPLESLHSKAQKEAEASECANELGGNDVFWKFVDRLFEVTPSNDGLDLALLPKIAQDVGVDKAKFSSCLQSGRHAARVQKDLEDAQTAGAEGTPFSVVLARDGSTSLINGALPFEQVKLSIDEALKK